MSLARDGSASRYQVWGSTSRFTQVDDRVSIEGGTVSIERNGPVKAVKAPAVFFVADSYAPVVATEQLWRYWAAHGRQAELTVTELTVRVRDLLEGEFSEVWIEGELLRIVLADPGRA